MSAFRPMPTFTGKERLELWRGDTLIGVITNLDSDWPWMIGDIDLTPAAEEYKKIWHFFETQDESEEPDWDLDEIDTDWHVRFPDGDRQDVFLPMVDSQNEIWWRDK